MPTFTALASSSFTGTDENPLSEGGVWTQSTGENAFQRVSAAATPTVLGADSGMHYTGVASPNNQYSRASLTVNGTAGGTAGIGLKVRQASAAQTYYRFIIDHAASANAAVNRIVGGASTLLGAAWTQTFVDGDQFTFTIEGTIIRVFDKNLAVVFTFDDVGGGGPTTGAFGIDYSSSETSASLDNWEGGTFTNSGSANPSPSSPSRRMISYTRGSYARRQLPTLHGPAGAADPDHAGVRIVAPGIVDHRRGGDHLDTRVRIWLPTRSERPQGGVLLRGAGQRSQDRRVRKQDRTPRGKDPHFYGERFQTLDWSSIRLGPAN